MELFFNPFDSLLCILLGISFTVWFTLLLVFIIVPAILGVSFGIRRLYMKSLLKVFEVMEPFCILSPLVTIDGLTDDLSKPLFETHICTLLQDVLSCFLTTCILLSPNILLLKTLFAWGRSVAVACNVPPTAYACRQDAFIWFCLLVWCLYQLIMRPSIT